MVYKDVNHWQDLWSVLMMRHDSRCVQLLYPVATLMSETSEYILVYKLIP